MGVAGAVAGAFGIQPLVGAFGVPYQAAEPRDERLIRVPLRIGSEMSQGVMFGLACARRLQRSRDDHFPQQHVRTPHAGASGLDLSP